MGLLKLTRPTNAIIAGAGVIVGYILAGRFPSIIPSIAGIWACIFALAFGNVINDILHIEIDKLIKPQRPLPSGKISISTAKTVCVILLILSLIPLPLLPKLSILIALSALILLYLYPLYLKSIPIIGNITVAILGSLPIVFGASISGRITSQVKSGLTLALLIHLLREIIKDIADRDGDEKGGITTIATMLQEKTYIIARIVGGALLIYIPIPYLMKTFSPAYLYIATIGSALPILWVIIQGKRKPPNTQEKIVKIAMIGGILALIGGVVCW